MIAVYPMVEEDEARGRVAAVYAAALEEAPFVPSLLKSLAVCPPYLALAWDQAAPVLGSPALADAVERVIDEVADAATPPPGEDDRELLGSFARPLGRMLLVACGLLAALDDDLGDRPAATEPALDVPAETLERPVPSVGDLAADAPLFARVRAALDTPIVNSIWRRAAQAGRLGALWSHLEPQTTATQDAAARVRASADALARDLPWDRAATPAALRRAGVEDAAPGVTAVLRAYALTLARVLALVACCTRPSEPGRR